MRIVKVIFKNGDSITTRINGTEDEIRDYYIGKVFNIDNVKDDLQEAIGIKFLD